MENSSRAMIFSLTIHLLFFSKKKCYSAAVAAPQILYSVLNPSLSKDIEVLEYIQRRVTELVEGLVLESYEEQLRELGALPLEKRTLWWVPFTLQLSQRRL